MRRRRGGVLRGLVELALLVTGIALLGLFVGLARGAELETAHGDIPTVLSSQQCTHFQVRSRAWGFKIGDKHPDGELRAFGCVGYAPAAMIAKPLSGWLMVRLVDLPRPAAQVQLVELQRP